MGPEVRARLDDFDPPDGGWPMVRAEEWAIPELVTPADGRIGLPFVLRFYELHVHPDHHEAFSEGLREIPSLSVDEVLDGMVQVSEAIYEGLPFHALQSLWTLWPDIRPVVHGRLIMGGRHHGVDDLDAFDVACLVWSDLEARVTASPFTVGDPKKAVELRDQLMSMQRRPGGDKKDVDALLERMRQRGGAEASGPSRPRAAPEVAADPEAKVHDLRSRMGQNP